MLLHNLVALWILSLCLLLVLIVPLSFHCMLITLLDQITGHNIKRCPQYIEFYWCFSCQEYHPHLYLDPCGVFFRNKVLSRDVGNIMIFLARDAVVNQ